MRVQPNGCFTTNCKRTIDFIDHYIVEKNDKTARKSIKEVNPEKKQFDSSYLRQTNAQKLNI
jgi:hypothetical protein